MTSDRLAGLPLEAALALLREEGDLPDIVFSEPPGGYRDMNGRTARVVRFDGCQLLCSYFRDAEPEAQ